MLAKSDIQATLKALDIKYRKATKPKDALFYSKLAVLELCGWIEESMDDSVRRCAKKHLKVQANRDFVEERVIDKTYAFDYNRFRFMLIRVVGIINVERLEQKMNSTILSSFKSSLGALKKVRDSEAHTHIHGVTKTIDAPSVIRSQFKHVYAGLKEIETLLRSAKI